VELPELARTCGAAAVASHRTAARPWQLELVDEGAESVTEPRNRSRLVVPGWLVHRRDLRPEETVSVDGVRFTTPLRTVLDLSRCLPLEEAVAVADSALRLRTVSVEEVRATLTAAWGHHAARARAVAPLVDARSESVLESLFAVALHIAGLDPPARQHIVRERDGTFVARVDFCWPDQRLVVETDGFAFHSDREAYRRDRNRLNALERLGWRVLRFSWEDVRHRTAYVMRTIESCLHGAVA
jgi:hypothetical protein